MAAKVKTITDLCNDRYSDPDIAEWVAQGVENAGTGALILSGQRSLLSPEDAERNYRREKNIASLPATPEEKDHLIMELQSRVGALENAAKPKG